MLISFQYNDISFFHVKTVLKCYTLPLYQTIKESTNNYLRFFTIKVITGFTCLCMPSSKSHQRLLFFWQFPFCFTCIIFQRFSCLKRWTVKAFICLCLCDLFCCFVVCFRNFFFNFRDKNRVYVCVLCMKDMHTGGDNISVWWRASYIS